MAHIGKNLSQIYRLQREFLKPVLEPYHVPSNAHAFILTIGRNPGISQKQLCEKIQMDEALATRLVRKLEEQNIIYKKRNANDLRAFQLYLTDKGHQLFPAVEARLELWWDTLFKDLPRDYIEDYVQTMTQRANQLLKEEKNNA